MSDQSQGPGWWQATDGKWYSPEQHPDYKPPAAPAAPPPPQQAYQPPSGPPVGQQQRQPLQQQAPQSRAEAKADAKASAARAKAMRPWFKKKRFMIPLVLVLIGGIAAVAGGGGDDDDGGNNTASGDNTEQTTDDGGDDGGDENPNSSEANLWDRPDEKDGDKEREIGGAVDLSGYTVTVTAAQREQQLDGNQFLDAGYLTAQVSLLNRDSGAQAYNTFDWKLITPTGTIIDPTFAGDQLGSGDLAGGGTIDGRIVWEIGDTAGDYYIVYDPDAFNDDNRGIWKVTV